MAISGSLIRFLRDSFRLEWDGIHGAPHWARVRDNGLRLAKTTGADVQVVEYFALLHDSCRRNDGHDPDHGPRAAALAKTIRSPHIQLGVNAFDLLVEALETHTGGTTHDNVTIATCWDSDRLDLGRVDIVPDPKYLVTSSARDQDMIHWAWKRSIIWRERYLQKRVRSG
jgi:uncharacterized protein